MDQQRRPVATFDDYLLTLDAWEYDLLRHSTLFADAFTINDDLRTSFLAGSDGSETYSTDGAFGWMISNGSGERAASGMGPSRGWRMDSYRAECSGMLSLLRFLITDSQSMLEKLFGRAKARSGEPMNAAMLVELDVMSAKWDLLREIQVSLRLLPEVSLQYVQGHQDTRRAYMQLSLLAQMWMLTTKQKSINNSMGKLIPLSLCHLTLAPL
jgi:hypothetical protein